MRGECVGIKSQGVGNYMEVAAPDSECEVLGFGVGF